MQLGSRFAGVAMFALAGCAAEPAPDSAAQERAAAEAVEQIVAASTPPPFEREFQRITAADIRKGSLDGAGCAFTVTGQDAPVAMAQGDRGALKFDGNLSRLAPDAGSAEGPFGSREKYDGLRYSFRIDTTREQPARNGAEGFSTPATLTVRDEYDRVVYERRGTATCRA